MAEIMENEKVATAVKKHSADEILDIDISKLDVFSKGRERIGPGNDFSEHQATTGPGADPIND